MRKTQYILLSVYCSHVVMPSDGEVCRPAFFLFRHAASRASSNKRRVLVCQPFSLLPSSSASWRLFCFSEKQKPKIWDRETVRGAGKMSGASCLRRGMQCGTGQLLEGVAESCFPRAPIYLTVRSGCKVVCAAKIRLLLSTQRTGAPAFLPGWLRAKHCCCARFSGMSRTARQECLRRHQIAK